MARHAPVARTETAKLGRSSVGEGTIAFFGLIGAAIGAIPGMLGVVVPWLRNRDKTSRAMRDLDLAKKEVEFISAWLDAVAAITDEEERKAAQKDARARLDSVMCASREASDSLVATQIADRQEKRQRKGSILLFAYLGFYLFMLLGASIDENDDVSLAHFVKELGSEDTVAALIVFALPLLFLAWRWHRSGRVAA